MGIPPYAKILTAIFFGAILTMNAARCWIVRLPCKTEANFTVKVQGHILRNYVIGEGSALKVDQCFENCEDHHGCKSINYKDGGEKNCQLNSKVKEAVSASHFAADGAWTYYATDYNTANIGTYCEDYTPCSTGTYCIDTCQCPGYQCIECSPGYGFKYETQCTDINECGSNPCQNSAACINHVNRFECTCMPGYSGVRCENDINECGSNPCQNGATCTNHVNRFHCSCAPGYNGVRCENDIDECGSNPCRHGATCANHVNRFQCNCVAGYSGVHCETDINECASHPCQNGATCINHINRFQCNCLPGYNGVRCETDINECSSSPCQNGGRCNDRVNWFYCTCLSTHYGYRCEHRRYETCNAAHAEGLRSNGNYYIRHGFHFCVLDGSICGTGGWTLAMKSMGDSDVFKADSDYWTTTRIAYQSPSLNKANAKFGAFNWQSFNKICLAIKKYQESTYRTLVVDKSSSSLLSIFNGGESVLGLSRATWAALRSGAFFQNNCNRNGFNIRDNRGGVGVRFGILGNNENDCRTPDSAIGIGIGSYEKTYMNNNGDASQYMAYLFVK